MTPILQQARNCRTAIGSSPSTTNQHQILLTGKVEPTDSLTLKGTFGNFWLAEEWASTTTVVNQNEEQYLGSEADITLTWDYTEDVQFGLLTAWFFPGDHFANSQDDVATDVVGSVSLNF
ncbi:hypothetical protein OMAG_002755 [Candidatus Omnitrophus magneticus]|uniref:Alginate export domain-containing protein n=1 Tax=Candidatus Omnitrophus magneticus TaxID=1609969 RepID=A0A0F0CN03_9BACT|nr:hypothetical protein OMAG_002755 [Candidatus Omnitrophus magneticus]